LSQPSTGESHFPESPSLQRALAAGRDLEGILHHVQFAITFDAGQGLLCVVLLADWIIALRKVGGEVTGLIRSSGREGLAISKANGIYHRFKL